MMNSNTAIAVVPANQAFFSRNVANYASNRCYFVTAAGASGSNVLDTYFAVETEMAHRERGYHY